MAKNETNFLKYIPEKVIGWETGENGNVYLLKVKSGNRILKKIIDIFGKSQYFRIHLDELGTLVWKNIDGEKSVEEIAESILHERGDDLPMAQERVSQFVATMIRNKFAAIVEQ